MMFGRKPDTPYQFEIHCLSAADGKTIWKQTAADKKPLIGANPTNGYATETPVTDGERVYAYFGGIGMVYCYDLDGKPLWNSRHRRLSDADEQRHGQLARRLADGRLFIQCDNDEKSFLVALDAKTGKEVWRTPRDERNRLEHALGLEELEADGDCLSRRTARSVLRSPDRQATLGAGRN